MLHAWNQRPIEEANLFNPAFNASLIYEFVKSYAKTHKCGAPLTLLPIMLTVVLHRPTRSRLPGTSVTSLYEWIQNNEDLLIGFSDRYYGILPYGREALMLAFHAQTLVFSRGHSVQLGSNQGHFPASYLREATEETRDIVKKTQFLSRWFAKSGSEASVLSAWGIKS